MQLTATDWLAGSMAGLKLNCPLEQSPSPSLSLSLSSPPSSDDFCWGHKQKTCSQPPPSLARSSCPILGPPQGRTDADGRGRTDNGRKIAKGGGGGGGGGE